LLIDPHLLGVWLGDGNSYGGHISLGGEDKEWLQSLGGRFVPSNSTQGRYGTYSPRLHQGLKAEDLIGNKHIPDKYLMASAGQRLSLLQGLMDTDGSCLKGGNAEFVNTNLNITDGVEFLLASLGIKCKRTERIGRFNGINYRPFVRLGFTAPRAVPLFTLERKLNRQREAVAEQSTTRNVQYAEPVGLVSGRCLTVEGGMYLAGREMIPTPTYEGRAAQTR
jgi:intein/homing endonuclease